MIKLNRCIEIRNIIGDQQNLFLFICNNIQQLFQAQTWREQGIYSNLPTQFLQIQLIQSVTILSYLYLMEKQGKTKQMQSSLQFADNMNNESKNQIIESSGNSQTNDQFKEDGLQINLDSIFKIHPHIENTEQLVRIIDESIDQVKIAIQIIKPHQTIDKYLKRAKTNKQELLVGYNNILNTFIQIKEKTVNKTVNATLVAQIMYCIVNVFKRINFNQLQTIDKAIWFLEFQCKVHCSLDLIITALQQKDDITTWPKQKQKVFWSNTKIQNLGEQKKLRQRFQYLKKILGITTTAVINQQKSDWAISKLASFGMTYPMYIMNDKQSQLISMRFNRNPKVQLAKKIWNLPQNGMISQMAKLALKNVKSNIKIYIPFDEQTLPKNILKNDGKSIQVRLLCNQQLYIKNTQKNNSSSFACVCASPIDENDFHEFTEIILHMHGGGFIALSSRSMQTYTRRWTRKLKIPVFSIDYRMPPDHPFPTAPQDCLKVYKFLLKHIHKYFNINPKKVILAGDSAGGNLALSLNGLILKNNLPIPYGIYTAYPATDVRKKFSPSKIHAFTDPLLSPAMLLLCLKQYIGQSQENQCNPIASPYFLTQQFVGGQKGDKLFPKKWPKTIIHVGAKDPLYDDSLKIAYKLFERGIPYELHIYEDMSHGFLNLDFVIEECKKAVQDSIVHLQKLLK